MRELQTVDENNWKSSSYKIIYLIILQKKSTKKFVIKFPLPLLNLEKYCRTPSQKIEIQLNKYQPVL